MYDKMYTLVFTKKDYTWIVVIVTFLIKKYIYKVDVNKLLKGKYKPFL